MPRTAPCEDCGRHIDLTRERYYQRASGWAKSRRGTTPSGITDRKLEPRYRCWACVEKPNVIPGQMTIDEVLT